MRLMSAAVAIVSLVFWSPSAKGDAAALALEGQIEVPVEALAAALLAWLAPGESPVTNDAPPLIRFAPAEALKERYRPGATSVSSGGGTNIQALYDSRERTIYLREGWTGRDVGEISELVHELVHHRQQVGGARYGCPEQREAEAYAAQARWLALFGADLSAVGVDPLFVLLLGTCGF